MITHAIISYLPDNEDLRNARKELHKKQLDWLRAQSELGHYDIKIIVVAQNYRDEDYLDGVEYVKLPNPVGAGGARNILLRMLYDSNEDFYILHDDDSILYDYYQPYKFLKELDTNYDKFKYADIICPVEPMFCGFIDINNKYDCKHNYIFTRTGSTRFLFTIVKNFKKYYNKTYYMEGLDAALGEGYEDLDFCFNLIVHGHSIYKNVSMVLKDMAPVKSVIFTDPDMNNTRLKLHKQNIKSIEQRWSKYGIYKGTQNRWTISQFYSKHGSTLKSVCTIPRQIYLDDDSIRTSKRTKVNKSSLI